jgi:RNA polymerase sigma factor (sigma-70 family)
LQVEKQLWIRVGRDDEEAYAEVYRFYYRRFYNYGRKFTSDVPLVEDSVQEALMAMWDKRHTLASIEHTASYFYTAFRYILFQKIRQKQRISSDAEATEEPDFPVEEVIIANETNAALQAQLQKALVTLTPRQREAIFLRFYEGLSYDEVAAVLGITTKATYKIMARALAQLKEHVMFSGMLCCVLHRLFFGG